ncbi:MAG: UvrB/UvrC motif-containing protein [Planctomycetota bacterium]
MLCENCNEKPATFHVVEITDGQKHEVHLCEDCAREKNIGVPQSLSLNEILSSLMEAHTEKEAPELSGVSCPACGMTYAEFKRSGRLGCPRDYAVFRKGLEPFLERIHGATRHKGKTPHRPSEDSATTAELLRLRRDLDAAVESEEYERAAQIRDRIHKLREGQQTSDLPEGE